MMRFVLGLVVLTLTLSACFSPEGEPVDNVVLDVFGPFTATGTISATGTSLYRRGTHVLKIEGRSRFFLESRTVNLRAYEGAYVVLEGEMQPNTHPHFLPVLQVTTTRLLRESQMHEVQQYAAPTLSLSLSAPQSWIHTEEGGSLSFTLPTEKEPFVRIQQTTDELPIDGLYIRLDGFNGTRIVDEELGMHRVFVQRGDRMTVFTFAPKGEESLKLREAFYTMLQSVAFDEQPTQEDSNNISDDSPRIPCGGPAKVLCPEGMYCAVEDVEMGIGVCKKI